RLNTDATRADQPIRDEAHAAKEARADALDVGGHLDRGILVEPAPRLDIDGFARRQYLLEDVAVAVQPEDAVAAACGEAVDEETGAAEEHGADASYALETVVDIARGREELVLAHLDLLAGAEMDGEDMSGSIAGEADLAVPGRLRHEDLHARDHP